MKKIAVVFSLSLTVVLFACHKEGNGGKASLEGIVKHHATIIPFSEVYIKYAATELPSTNVSYYDDHVPSDANGHYEIKNLYKGDYYLYAVGYDSLGGYLVKGGIHIKIKKNIEINQDIPVTE